MSTGKRSLYRPAVTLNKECNVGVSDSPKFVPGSPRLPPSPSPITPPVQYTDSLSLSDIEESSIEDINTQLSVPNVKTSGNPVLVTSAMDDNEMDFNSTLVPVAISHVPSPVKIIRHSPLPSQSHGKRFSSSFISPMLTLEDNGSTETQQEKNSEAKTSNKEHFENGHQTDNVSGHPIPTMSLQYHLQTQGTGGPQYHVTKDDQTTPTQKEIQSILDMGSEQQDDDEQGIETEKSEVQVMRSNSDGVTIENTTSDTCQSMNLDFNELSSQLGKKKTKKGGKIVPSRYMAAANSFKKPQMIPTDARRKTKVSTSKRVPEHTSFRVRSNNSLAGNLSFNPTIGALTSTPAQMIGNSRGIHQPTLGSSFTGISDTIPNYQSTQKTTKLAKVPSVKKSSQMNTKLLETRLLQMVYLDVMSLKAVKDQEEQAQSQLQALWNACEKQRREVAELDRAIEYEQRSIALDKSINTQLNGLNTLCGQLSRVQNSHSVMSKALDTTRHELQFKDVFKPEEDRLLKVLNETEHLVGEIVSTTREHLPNITSLANNHKELLKTIEKEYQEVEKTWKKLSVITKQQLKETSLYFEDNQRHNLSRK